MSSVKKPVTTSRRGFLKAGAATALAITVSRVAPARAVGANERISFGIIGCGESGTRHVDGLITRDRADNVDVSAVADVDPWKMERARYACRADGYLDYRRLLERDDVDAVVIATSGQSHASIAMDALASGKHVLVETPMARSVSEALALRAAVRRAPRVLHVGSQTTGEIRCWQANNVVNSGRIGKATWGQARCDWNSIARLSGERSGYDPALQQLYHTLARLLVAIAGPSGAYPTRVKATFDWRPEKDRGRVEGAFLMTADYPDSFSIFLASAPANNTGVPARIYGKSGVIDLDRELRESVPGATVDRVPFAQMRESVGNFIETIRGKSDVYCGNIELGAATTVAVTMAVESCRQKRTMVWDAKNAVVADGQAVEV